MRDADSGDALEEAPWRIRMVTGRGQAEYRCHGVLSEVALPWLADRKERNALQSLGKDFFVACWR